MENIIISGIFFLLLFIAFWQMREIKKSQENIDDVLEGIDETLCEISKSNERDKQKEVDSIVILRNICSALDHVFRTEQKFMNQTSAALYNVVLCMIPIINDIQQCALEDEDYERANECSKILYNLQQIANNK